MATVLLPCDGSSSALLAVRHAVDAFRRGDVLMVHLLNVQPPFSAYVARHVSRELRADFHRERADEALVEARRSAADLAAAAGFAGAFVFAAANVLYQRRRRLEERHAAKQALQRAYDDLEVRIAARTADLVAANAQLQDKVAALKQTEQILRETQDNAVQAGKLAVLGQMAAGVTHELNQPLAALTTLSDNSVKLIQLERTEEVRENLRMMGQLAQRMGRIVGQLKAFARKGPAEMAPVGVAAVQDGGGVRHHVRLHTCGGFELVVPPGRYRVMAFDDAHHYVLEDKHAVLVPAIRRFLDAHPITA